jgi:hypothetical protein
MGFSLGNFITASYFKGLGPAPRLLAMEPCSGPGRTPCGTEAEVGGCRLTKGRSGSLLPSGADCFKVRPALDDLWGFRSQRRFKNVSVDARVRPLKILEMLNFMATF